VHSRLSLKSLLNAKYQVVFILLYFSTGPLGIRF